MPIIHGRQTKSAKRKALDEKARRRRLAFSEIDPNVPSWVDHIPHGTGSTNRFSSSTDQNLLRSTHEQNLLLTSHGHRTRTQNLEK